jgi:hypothetical protein
MIILVFLLWNAAWWTLIGSLIQSEISGGWWGVTALALLAVAPLAVLVAGFRGALYPPAFIRVWILRPFWYIQLLLPFLGIAGVIGVVAGLPFGAAGTGGRWSMAIFAVLYIAAAAWGYMGMRRLDVRRLDLRFPSLPEGLDGMRIAQLSDIHIGPHTSKRHIRRILTAVLDAKPDLIAITGDQVDDYARDVEIFADAFQDLNAPLGVYAVPGNHDVYAGWDAVRSGLEEMGITVLVNQAVSLNRNGARFWVAGTGDPAGRSWQRGGGRSAVPDIERTLARVPSDAFVVALAHNPALWPALAAAGVALTLSGHTHHGQISIPHLKWSLASLFLEHAMDMYRDGTSILYINPGTNFWGIPLRIGAMPEVTVVTIQAER